MNAEVRKKHLMVLIMTSFFVCCGLFHLDLKTKEDQCIYAFQEDETGATYTDGNYFYYGNINPMITLYGTPLTDRFMDIYDMDWNLVQRIEFPEGEILCYQMTTEDRVLFSIGSWEIPANRYLEIGEVGTDRLEWKQ